MAEKNAWFGWQQRSGKATAGDATGGDATAGNATAGNRSAEDRMFAGWGFLAAVAFGWCIELLYALAAEPDWQSCLRTFSLLWFASAAAFFAGTIGGFLFGVPKSVSNPDPSALVSSRYKSNTNLEEISDWLTKIILGLGLVNVGKVISFIDAMGEQAGSAIGHAQGAKVIAISAMIYGFVCGFIVVYIWTSTDLRENLERNENPGRQ